MPKGPKAFEEHQCKHNAYGNLERGTDKQPPQSVAGHTGNDATENGPQRPEHETAGHATGMRTRTFPRVEIDFFAQKVYQPGRSNPPRLRREFHNDVQCGQ